MMTHQEFVSAYAEGRVRVDIDKAAAARYLSSRLLLPFVMLPVLGAGIAAALVGWIWSGLGIIALGIVASRVIKRSAPHFLLTQALDDEAVYAEVTAAKIVQPVPLDGA